MPQTEEQKARRKELDFINRDKIREQKNAWYLENKDKTAVYNKEYKLKNHKKLTITRWKSRGLISDDYDALYDYYISVKNCEICCVELTSGEKCKTRRAMDHDHKTGLFRNVLCDGCNLNLKE